MKKMILLSMILPCMAFAQSLVFSNQTITVEPSQLSLESVSFQPLEIVTNQVSSWVPVTVVTTNGLIDGGAIVTNEVTQQVFTAVVSTNSAGWTAAVIFSLPAGHKWALNNFPVTVERFRVRVPVPLDPDAVQAAFGASTAGLEFAAQNGAYKPAGTVRDTFLSLAADVLGGAQ